MEKIEDPEIAELLRRTAEAQEAYRRMMDDAVMFGSGFMYVDENGSKHIPIDQVMIDHAMKEIEDGKD